jgi:uncharacterized peroxidase-related enzyme
MKTLKPVTLANAPEGSKGILDKIQKGYGFIPNLLGTLANSPAILEGYVSMDAAWEKSSLSPSDRQLVLLTASAENSCTYCIAAHSTILIGMMKMDSEIVQAVRTRASSGDSKKDALVSLVREMVSERGQLSEATQKRFFDQGYTQIQLTEILLGIALKTISNYFDHFNPVEIDAGFKAQA